MPAEIRIYNPEQLGPPMGQYTHVARVKASEFLFIAGMLSGDAAGNVIGEGELLCGRAKETHHPNTHRLKLPFAGSNESGFAEVCDGDPGSGGNKLKE
jgi:hypothetical protein